MNMFTIMNISIETDKAYQYKPQKVDNKYKGSQEGVKELQSRLYRLQEINLQRFGNKRRSLENKNKNFISIFKYKCESKDDLTWSSVKRFNAKEGNYMFENPLITHNISQ